MINSVLLGASSEQRDSAETKAVHEDMVEATLALVMLRKVVQKASAAANVCRDRVARLVGDVRKYSGPGVEVWYDDRFNQARVDVERLAEEHPEWDIDKYVIAPCKTTYVLQVKVSPELAKAYARSACL